ncbi:MAG: FMN-binding negative transcriptional regulator, partial [Burkholderiaceae bacterium]
LVRRHPLGLLVTRSGDGALAADAIPWLLDVEADGTHTLRGHVARANPVWREARGDVDSLVVFQGPQAYVSPSLYASKAEHGKVVPTWNYIMVQARGRFEPMDDAAWTLALVTRLTERHESTRAAAWAVSDAPAEFVDSMLRAIVGVQLRVESISGKWKVSQNRSVADQAGVRAGLQADAMNADTALPAPEA